MSPVEHAALLRRRAQALREQAEVDEAFAADIDETFAAETTVPLPVKPKRPTRRGPRVPRNVIYLDGARAARAEKHLAENGMLPAEER